MFSNNVPQIRSIDFCSEKVSENKSPDNIIQRKKSELDAKRECECLNRLLTRLSELIQDVTQDLIEAKSRKDIERAVCDRVTVTDVYEFAWIGEPNLSHDVITANTWEGIWEPAPETLEYDYQDIGRHPPAVRAYETSETHLVEDSETLASLIETNHWIGADQLYGIVAIPLIYRKTRYGVLTVYTAQKNRLNECEIVVLEALARTAAAAISALERGRILAADSILDIEFTIPNYDLFFIDLSAETNSDLKYNGSVYRDDGSALLFFTTDAAPSTVKEIMDEHSDVKAVTLVNEHAQGSLFEFTVSGTSIITKLAERGVKTRSLTAADGEGRISVELPNEADVRDIAHLLKEHYSGTELVSQHKRERPPTTKGEFTEEFKSRLTERQLTTLKKAYISESFQWTAGFFQRTSTHASQTS